MKFPLFRVLGFILLTGQWFPAMAQGKMEKCNSAEINAEGYKHILAGEYEKAIKAYLQVNRADTNYLNTLTELTYCYLNSEQPEKVIEVMTLAQMPDKVFSAPIYINWGTALEAIDSIDLALQKYSEGIDHYPLNASLYYNRAVTHMANESPDQTLADLKMALELNPFHARSHMMLGSMALEEGEMVRAMLSFYTNFIIAVDNPTALDVLVKLDEILGQDMKGLEKKGRDLGPGDNFAETERIIESMVALNDKYKVKSPLEFNIVKQAHAMMESLTYRKNDEGFWMQFYVPFYKELFDKGEFKDFSLLILYNSDNKLVQSEVKKNKSGITDFNDWFSERWGEMHLSKKLFIDNKWQTVDGLVLDRQYIRLIGSLDKKTGDIIGDFRLYFDDGSQEVSGSFSPKNERTGVWKSYYPGSVFLNEVIWENNQRNGPYEEYFFHGPLYAKGQFKNGFKDGTCIDNYPSGAPYSVVNYSEGKYDGERIEFNRRGDTVYVANFKMGENDGPETYYHANGKISTVIEMKDGKRNGSEKKFFYDGSLEKNYQRKDGALDGPYEIYYLGGQLKEEGTFKEGNLIGDIKEYYPDGKLFSLTTYEASGKMNGTMREYDLDGILYSEWDFKAGEIVGYRYYDKEGNILAADKRSVFKFPFKAYWEDGTPRFEGDYDGSVQNGKWTYFDRYGGIQSVNPYQNGLVEGTATNYFQNGKIDYQTEFKDGEENGYYVEYFRNGNLFAQGYYLDGKRDGEWRFYYHNGVVKRREYYANGEVSGWRSYYDVFGKLTEENYLMNGTIAEYRMFDTAGVLSATTNLLKVKTTYQENHFNGQLYTEIPYISQSANGKIVWYMYGGLVSTTGELIDDERHGTWKWYHSNGKVRIERNYVMGSIEGEELFYYPSGQVDVRSNYLNNDEYGEKTYYHQNGQVKTHGKMYKDEWNGEVKSYDAAGNLMMVRYFLYGKILGYSYEDVQGKLLPMFPFEDGNGKLTAYYRNGKPSANYIYAFGERDGLGEEFSASGKKMVSSNYAFANFDGERLDYYEDGSLYERTTYLDGVLNGIYQRYHPNGKLEMEEQYLEGNKYGVAKYYTSSGELQYEVEYYNNKVVNEKKY